jgi:hypothetical protein
VGGEITEQVLESMALEGRVAVCGMISQYDQVLGPHQGNCNNLVIMYYIANRAISQYDQVRGPRQSDRNYLFIICHIANPRDLAVRPGSTAVCVKVAEASPNKHPYKRQVLCLGDRVGRVLIIIDCNNHNNFHDYNHL